jgi:hypothetical protein
MHDNTKHVFLFYAHMYKACLLFLHTKQHQWKLTMSGVSLTRLRLTIMTFNNNRRKAVASVWPDWEKLPDIWHNINQTTLIKKLSFQSCLTNLLNELIILSEHFLLGRWLMKFIAQQLTWGISTLWNYRDYIQQRQCGSCKCSSRVLNPEAGS